MLVSHCVRKSVLIDNAYVVIPSVVVRTSFFFFLSLMDQETFAWMPGSFAVTLKLVPRGPVQEKARREPGC